MNIWPVVKIQGGSSTGMEGCNKVHWEEIKTAMTGATTVSISFSFFITGLHVTKHTHSWVVVFQPISEARGGLESIHILLT